MAKASAFPVDVSGQDVPLRQIQARSSADSALSSDFGHLLSDDGSEATFEHLDDQPTDGGRGAWLFLAGNWLLEATAWAFILSFGIFQKHYVQHELFSESDLIPSIGTLATGISYLGMPFTNMIALRWPRHRRATMFTGFAMCMLGLLGASFATQAWHLLLFQGLLYGVGWVVCYTPFLFMLNEWFIEKRGLAYGILFSGSGASGLVIPFAVGWSLERFGFRTTLRASVMVITIIGGTGLMLMRPRYKHKPIGAGQNDYVNIPSVLATYSQNVHLLSFLAGVTLHGLGFFLPNVFLPAYAQAAGLSSAASSGLLAIMFASQTVGQLSLGWTSDRVNVYIPASLSSLIPGLAAIFLWGPGKGMARLGPFAALWGFFSSSYTVLFTRMCTAIITSVQGDALGEDAFMALYSVLHVARGVTNIIEGPISSWLLNGQQNEDLTRFGLGRYAGVVWFTAFCMLASSLTGACWIWLKLREKR